MARCNAKAEKWLRIWTSIGALYLESAMYGAIFPLLSGMEWASTRPDHVSAVLSNGSGGQTEAQPSPAVGAIFFSTGVLEFGFSPVAGLLADRFGFDAVLSLGLLISIIKCLLYGVMNTSMLIITVGRLLQGIASACLQPIGIARIKDLYDDSSKECSNILALAMAKISFTYFAGLFTGQLFDIMRQRVFLLFIPISCLLMFGILVTCRADNFHSSRQSEGDSTSTNRAELKTGTSRWRVFGDAQIIILALCFFVADTGRTSLDPSLGIWIKSAFGADVSTVSLVFGLCGAAILSSSILSAQIVPIVKDRLWVYGILTLGLAGVTLTLLNSTNGVLGAGSVLFVHSFAASGTRFTLISMCSTLADERYATESGLVFGLANMGLAAAILAGPPFSVIFFHPVYLIYAIGATYFLCTVPMAYLRQFNSKYGPNFMDYFHGSKRCEYRVVNNSPVNIPISFRSVPVQLGYSTDSN